MLLKGGPGENPTDSLKDRDEYKTLCYLKNPFKWMNVNPSHAEFTPGNDNFLMLRWQFNSFLVENKDLFILQIQYYFCWLPVASFTNMV